MNILFDIIIFGFLLTDAFLIYMLVKKKQDLPRLFFFIAICFASLAWGVIFYGSFIEPRRIIIVEDTVELNGESENQFRAAVISDLHVGPYKDERFVEKVVNRTLEQNPEVVFLIGDYVYKHAKDADKLAPLARLAETVPVYAVMGNHDYDLAGEEITPDEELAEAVRSVLMKSGINVLENRGTYIAEDAVYLAGVQEIWTHAAEPWRAMGLRASADTPTILLSHNPDLLLTLDRGLGVDLIISGHTHGGQIRLPFIGPVGKIPAKLGQNFDRGLFEQDDVKLYITSGAGESGPRARLFNPPEIVMLTILY